MGTDIPAVRLWRRYEEAVAILLSAMDQNANVVHDATVVGQLSGINRQIDVLAKGSVVGHEITVAVECKRHRRPVEIGVMDQFVGKLLDIGADRGVLYSYAGFTDSAVARAIGARNPFVMAIALETPEVLQGPRAPGLPADLLAQDWTPQWMEEINDDSMTRFLLDGEWSKFWD
ncbi:restriction endonuclease [Nocardia asteroides]